MCLYNLYSPPPRPLPRLDHLESLVPLSSATYPGFYAALARLEAPFSPENAYWVCWDALSSRLTPRGFAALLDHCPPAETFCVPQKTWPSFDPSLRPLVEEACRHERADALDQLLRRGAALYPSAEDLLTTTILIGSVPCTRRLLQEERGTAALPYGLLELWAGSYASRPDADAVYRCLRLAAPRLTGLAYPRRGPVPLLPQLRPAHAAAARNFPLLRRICQSAGPITAEEGEAALNALTELHDPPSGLSDPLDALLTACPALLRLQPARRLLLLCRLSGPPEDRLLDPWLARLPQRQFPLWEDDLLGALDWLDSRESEGLLTRWQRLDAPPVIPVLDRNAPLPLRWWDKEDSAAPLLRLCPVWGEPPAGELSALARDVLSTANEALILDQLGEDGLLAREDRQALAAFCTGPDCPPRLAGPILVRLGPVPPRENYLL